LGLQRKFFALMFLIAGGPCGPVVAAEFAAEMESANSRWLAVYKSRDAQAFGPLYAPDAVILPQGGPPIQGRTAIVQFWFEMFKKQFRSPKLEIIDLREADKLAYQTCRWSVLESTEGAPAKKLTGNTLRIFERQRDGRWLIKVQMSNSDKNASPDKSGVKSVVTR
jgi:uncharacterized protein (TIGR02246 family)